MNLNYCRTDLYYTICIGLVHLFYVVRAKDYDWVTYVSENINKEIKPPSVVSFGSLNTTNRFNLLSQIEAPVINIQPDVRELSGKSKRAIFDFLHLKYSRSPNLYIIFERGQPVNSSLSRIKKSLHFIIWLFPSSIRPKCLLILFDTDILSVDYFSKVLLLAWSLKFLDFSMITVNGAAEAHIWSYFPFSESFYTSQLTAGAQIFPDKLENMHGYVLKFPLMHFPPNTIVRNETGLLKITGSLYAFFEIFSKVLNFGLDVIRNDWKLNTLIINTNETRVLNYFIDDVIDGLMIPFVSHKILTANETFAVGKSFFTAQIGIAVPRIRVQSIESSWQIGLIIAISIILVTLIRPVEKLMKVRESDYGIMDMYRNCLGWTACNSPKSRISIVIFISIFLISLVLSGEWFSILTSTRLVSKELELDTFKQINDANLTLHVPRYFEAITRSSENVDVQNLMERAQIIAGTPDRCFSELAKTMKCACVAATFRIQYYIRQQRTALIMKESKLLLHSDLSSFPFQKGSPYADKLSTIQQRIVEAGLPTFKIPLWGYEEANTTFNFEPEDFNMLSNNQILFALIIVSVFGFGCAFIVLVIEFRYYYYSKK